MKSRHAVTVAAVTLQILSHPLILQRIEKTVRPSSATLPFGAPAPRTGRRQRQARLALANLIQDIRS